MSELDKQTPRESVLAELTNLYRETAISGSNEEQESRFIQLFGDAQKLGASRYDIMKAEFLAEPENNRQHWLDCEAKVDIGLRMLSLEHAVEFMSSLLKIRDEFGLKDPYRVSQQHN